ATFRTIQAPTTTVWPTRKTGVPKKRAKASAFSPNQPSPKTGARCRCGRWKRRWWPDLGAPAGNGAEIGDGLETMAHLEQGGSERAAAGPSGTAGCACRTVYRHPGLGISQLIDARPHGGCVEDVAGAPGQLTHREARQARRQPAP